MALFYFKTANEKNCLSRILIEFQELKNFWIFSGSFISKEMVTNWNINSKMTGNLKNTYSMYIYYFFYDTNRIA